MISLCLIQKLVFIILQRRWIHLLWTIIHIHHVSEFHPAKHSEDCCRVCLYSISAFFIVIDKNSVINLGNTTDFSTNVKPLTVLLINEELILFTYFLQVRKSYFITVTIFQRLNLMHWLIFDGPLLQSNIINANEGKENTVKLSSFRCLLQILLKERNSSFLFSYSSILIQVNSNVHLDEDDHISVSLPNTECRINKNLCALNAFAKYGSQVNVSVIKFTYKGTNSKTCKYAGLVATQHLGVDDYKETKPFVNPMLAMSVKEISFHIIHQWSLYCTGMEMKTL